MKTRHFNIRLPIATYDKYVKMALVKGKKEKRIVCLSEVINTALDNYLKTM